MFSEDEILYSGIVLKELQMSLSKNDYEERLKFIKSEEKFIWTECTEEDFALARKLDSESLYSISFFDCRHTAVCKRMNAVLITRDNKLINFAKEYIIVKKPEWLLP